MSVLFPKVNKPREWDYRPIYFDEEKEARKDKRLARLRRGAFREDYYVIHYVVVTAYFLCFFVVASAGLAFSLVVLAKLRTQRNPM